MARNQGHCRIEKSGNQYITQNFAENGRQLSGSVQRFDDYETAISNIAAHLQLFGGDQVMVKDNVLNREVIVTPSGDVYEKALALHLQRPDPFGPDYSVTNAPTDDATPTLPEGFKPPFK